MYPGNSEPQMKYPYSKTKKELKQEALAKARLSNITMVNAGA
jgi:hypothetical protein